LSVGWSEAWAFVTIQVDSKADEIDDDVTDGVCHTLSGTCTLRAALMTANRETFSTQINLPAGIYTLAIPTVPGEDETSGDLNLTAPTNITDGEIYVSGAGANATIIDGAGLSRVFNIDSGRQATLNGLTVRGGTASDDEGGGILNNGILYLYDANVVGNLSDGGGGIANFGQLFLVRVTIANNIAWIQGGGIDNRGLLDSQLSIVSGNVSDDVAGGIYNDAQLTLLYSTLDSNSAPRGGGLGNYGTAAIRNSTFSNNSATDGGGIQGQGQLTMINSTVAGNHAANNGGGLNRNESNSGAWNVYNSTVAYNDADSDADQNGSGGGIYVEQSSGAVGTLNIYNTLVAGNTVQESPQPDDCSGNGVLNTHANNLFGSTAGCPIVQVSGSYGLVNSLSYLGPLQNNGGPTQTVALLRGSSAIDGGYSGGCFDENSNLIVVDQREFARPVGPACDVGAYEFSDVIFIDGFQ
jgi:predicted outer membrane repeat protein